MSNARNFSPTFVEGSKFEKFLRSTGQGTLLCYFAWGQNGPMMKPTRNTSRVQLFRDVNNVHYDKARLAFAFEFLECSVGYRKQPMFFIANEVCIPHQKVSKTSTTVRVLQSIYMKVLCSS